MDEFYHGTSDALPIKKFLLPAVDTGIQRESWRKKFTNVVFFTNSLLSAEKYARKACQQFGGSPVVYTVKPIGLYSNIVNNEFAAEKARIISCRKL